MKNYPWESLPVLKLVSYVRDAIHVVMFVKPPTLWKPRAKELLGFQSHRVTAHAKHTGKFHRLSWENTALFRWGWRVSACHYILQNSDIHSGLYNTKLNLFCMRIFVSLKNMYIVHFSKGLLWKQWSWLNENFQKDWIEHTKIHPWQKHMQKKMFRDMFSVKQTITNEMFFFQSF